MLPTTASHSTVRGLQQQSEETEYKLLSPGDQSCTSRDITHTEPHLETVSSVSRRLRLAREIALLSGSGNTGAMWRTSGDPGCSLTNHSSAACSPPIRAHLTPPSRQPREVAGEEGPDSQVRLSHSPAPYTARSP